MNIASRIKEIRESRNMTSKDFATSLKIDNSQYSKIEQGKLMPTLNLLMEINSIYGVSTDWILTGKEDTHKNKTPYIIDDSAPNTVAEADPSDINISDLEHATKDELINVIKRLLEINNRDSITIEKMVDTADRNSITLSRLVDVLYGEEIKGGNREMEANAG